MEHCASCTTIENLKGLLGGKRVGEEIGWKKESLEEIGLGKREDDSKGWDKGDDYQKQGVPPLPAGRAKGI